MHALRHVAETVNLLQSQLAAIKYTGEQPSAGGTEVNRAQRRSRESTQLRYASR